jgi:hypothetical protein
VVERVAGNSRKRGECESHALHAHLLQTGQAKSAPQGEGGMEGMGRGGAKSEASTLVGFQDQTDGQCQAEAINLGTGSLTRLNMRPST